MTKYTKRNLVKCIECGELKPKNFRGTLCKLCKLNKKK